MSAEDLRAWIALSLVHSGRPDQWLELAGRCGGARHVVTASDDELRSHKASAEAIRLLRAAWPAGADKVLRDCTRLGIHQTAIGSDSYPAALQDVPDRPLVLFWRGAAPASLAPALAVVGSRRCTAYGERTAMHIGRDAAAAGIVVVSGLARGIDAAAHRGALETGRTAAVLAGGLDRIYPSEHRGLAERILGSGGSLLSEQPPGVRPLPWLFPYRNRIITGLAMATVVVEATARSGSLASARHALAQGRAVFAVPGPIDSPLSEGTNGLITDGGPPFCRLTDLRFVSAYSSLLEKKSAKFLKNQDVLIATLDAETAAVFAAVAAGRPTPDEITAATSLDGTRVLALLTALELDGLIRREEHGRFRRASGIL